MSSQNSRMQLIFKKDDDIQDNSETPTVIRDAKNAEELYSLMHNPDLTWESANVLGRRGESGLYYLLEGLKNGNDYTRLNCARVLGILKNPRSVDDLIASLEDEDFDIIRKSAKALGEIGNPKALGPLSKLLSDQPQGFDAAEAILKIGGNGLDILFNALSNENPTVRLVSCHALSKSNDPKISKALIELMRDPDFEVRHSAVRALGERKETQALPYLLEALNEPEFHSEYFVIGALEEIGDSQAVLPLIDKLESTNIDICQKAHEVLIKLTGQDFGLDAGHWRSWWESQNHN